MPAYFSVRFASDSADCWSLRRKNYPSAQFRCNGVHEQAPAAFQDEPLFRWNVRQAQFPVLFQQRTELRKGAFHILCQIKVRIVALLINLFGRCGPGLFKWSLYMLLGFIPGINEFGNVLGWLSCRFQNSIEKKLTASVTGVVVHFPFILHGKENNQKTALKLENAQKNKFLHFRWCWDR